MTTFRSLRIRQLLGISLSLCVFFVQVFIYVPTVSADATGLTLAVVGDDTSALVSDTSTTNGIVPAGGGAVTYQWGWSDPGGTSATFSQSLPAGMEWGDESVVSGCSRTGTIDTGQTLTCTITGLSGIGVTNKVARVYNIANGATITTHLVSGSQTSANTSVTVAATPNVNFGLIKTETSYYDATDPDTPNTEAGLKIPFTFAFWTSRTSTDGAKGSESLQGPISFTASIPSGAKLSACSTGSEIRSEPYPLPSTTASSSSTSVPYSGTISCSQTGTDLTVTLSDTDTSFRRFPTATKNSVPIPNNGPGYFAVAGFYIWMPLTSFNTSTLTDVPVSISGVTTTSLSSQTFTTPTASATWSIKLETLSLKNYNPATQAHGIAIGAEFNAQNATVYPGETFTTAMNLAAPVGTGTTMTNVSGCEVWDISKSTILNTTNPVAVSSSNISPSPSVSDITVEYGTTTYADEAARKAADCGSIGDGNPNWYSSIAAAAASPGGLASVSAARFRYNQSFAPSKTINFQVSLVASSDPSLPNLTKIPHYGQSWSDQTAVTRSTWTVDGGAANAIVGRLGSGIQGGQATLSSASVRVSQSLSTATTKPGNSVTVTMQPDVRNPIVTDGRLAQNVVVRATLPDGCFTFVPGATAPDTLTPATPATPGVGQTCKDVAGQVAYWNLGDIASTPGVTETAISYGMNLSISAPTPYTARPSAYITSDSDVIISSSRGYTSALTVSAVSELEISLTANVSTATQGQPVIYRMNWSNGLPDNLGQAWIADVLPYNGDGRGTSGLGSLVVTSVTTSPTGLAVYYSTNTASTVQSALESDPTGSTGITWVSSKPSSGITAIRVRTQSLSNATTGYADISVTPSTLSKGGALGNSIYGKADNLDNPAIGASLLQLSSSTAEIDGNLTLDRDFSGDVSGSDQPLGNATVTLTGYAFGPNGISDNGTGDDIAMNISVTSASGGSYQFLIAPGRYSITTPAYTVITSPTFPFSLSTGATVTGKDFLVQQSLGSPSATPDSSVASQGSSVTILVLVNDSLAQASSPGPATTVTAITQPTTGTSSINNATTGSLSYTASNTWPINASGDSYSDQFTYTIRNAAGITSSSTVTVTVYKLPVANADTADVASAFSSNIDVTANDTGYQRTLDTSFTPTSNGAGSASVVSGLLQFSPGIHYWGSEEGSYQETITYRLRDGFGNTATSTALVTIYRAPVAVDDTIVVNPGTAVSPTVMENDLVYASPATITAISTPRIGSASIGENLINLSIPRSSSGTVTLSYSISDRLGQTSQAVLTALLPSDSNGSTPNESGSGSTNNGEQSGLDTPSSPSPTPATTVTPSPSPAFTPTPTSPLFIENLGNYGNDGIIFNLSQQQSGTFSLSTGGVIHTITATIVGNNSASLLITPDSTTIALSKNESRQIDLDGDGTKDIEVSLVATNQGTAQIRVRAITVSTTPQAWYEKNSFRYGILGAGIILFFLLFFIRRRNRRNNPT